MKKFYSRTLEDLFSLLRKNKYEIIGPKVQNGAITYQEISSATELPIGWTDEQGAGKYRLQKIEQQAYFRFVVGPHLWKKYLFPPHLKIFSARRNSNQFEVTKLQDLSDSQPFPKYAFIGVRSCELQALGIQDTIFIGGEYVDPYYKAIREGIFIVAVNCTKAAETCFCVSMNTGPKVKDGYDIVLTEVIENDNHYFIADSGTERGAEILNQLPHQTADVHEVEQSERLIEGTIQHIGRKLDTENIKQLLQENFDHPHWDNIAQRCLTCANCTMVCPTCFCSTVEDVTDLAGKQAERWNKWDSCFTMDFSYLHGGSIRQSTKSRYRQWITHKLANWLDQFGVLGCVGCGRCITWCPVGIDITEEVRAIRNATTKP